MGKKYKKDTFFDANGQLRMTGDQYYDAKGILRQPGDQYYDESGQLRTPIEEKEEDFALNNSINNIQMPSNSQNKYPSGSSGMSDKPITLGKILARNCHQQYHYSFIF